MTDKLRELVAEWRELYGDPKRAGDNIRHAQRMACADKLESVLDAEPQAKCHICGSNEHTCCADCETHSKRAEPQASDLERAHPVDCLGCDNAVPYAWTRGELRHHPRGASGYWKCARLENSRAESAAALAQKDAALLWCLENLCSGIEWGGPFDADHQQGEYHCTHCDARWKPNGPGEETHKENCGLVKARAALAQGKPRG